MKSFLGQGCNTLSKRESCYSYNAHKGKVDWVGGLGSQIDGWFVNPCITSPSAYKLAEMICKRWDYERVKFCSSGSEACSASIRIARAFNHKKIILQSGYHGHHDWTMSNKVPANRHIPYQYTQDFDSIIDIIKLLEITIQHHDISCVIIEPVQLIINFDILKRLRQLTKRLGILLIFDEIITGLRVPTGTVATWSKVKPDMICMGKAAGNGLPISWVMGSKKIMDNDEYFISATHAGNTYCCDIAMHMINKMTDKVIIDFYKRCNDFQTDINRMLCESTNIYLKGYGTRAEWQCENLNELTALWELMANRGHLLGRAFFMNLKHTDSMKEKFIKDLRWAVKRMKEGYKRQGPCVSFAFRRN